MNLVGICERCLLETHRWSKRELVRMRRMRVVGCQADWVDRWHRSRKSKYVAVPVFLVTCPACVYYFWHHKHRLVPWEDVFMIVGHTRRSS